MKRNHNTVWSGLVGRRARVCGGTEEGRRDPDKGMSGRAGLDKEALELGPE